ncbi:MAG: multicomponent Na+:H+ antiporter subunit [Clostridiales bacterium]|nr:multicomponent Na+:H+ antiporter subunit [Clostridiales bacterium]
MIRYGPIFCVVLLLVSAFYFQRTKRVHMIHQISGGIFFIAFILMLFNFYYINTYGAYLYPSFLSQVLGFKVISTLSVLVISVFYMTIAAITWFSNYSLRKYIDPSKIPTYYSLMHIMNAAITIVVFTDSFITLYVAYVIIIMAAYHMIQIKNKVAAPYEKLRFLTMNLFGLSLLFIGLSMMVFKTHAMDFETLHAAMNAFQPDDANYYTLSMTLCIVGLGVNGVLFPFFAWMPDLFATTPAPLSAQLSAVTIKISPIVMMKLVFSGYGINLFNALHLNSVLIVLGIASMLSGSIFAIHQQDLKKMIAYSTISQLGYVYLAIGIGNEYGIRIALYQLLAHAVTKAAIYMSVGSMYEQIRTTEINQLKGVGKQLPITLGCFALGALSMVGIPILPGFITKWNLSLATLTSGSIIPLFVILISAILNATYYVPIIINGFFGPHHIEMRHFEVTAKPFREVLPLVCLIGIMVLMGFFANSIFHFINAKELMAAVMTGGMHI